VMIPTQRRYRGLYRYYVPNFVFDYPQDHLVYQAWNDSPRDPLQPVSVEALPAIRQALQILNQHAPVEERCELIEITDYQQEPQAGTRFYGYDVASTYSHSPLDEIHFFGNVVYDEQVDIHPVEEQKDVKRTFIVLANRYFRARLNHYGLFDDYGDARLAAEFIASMKKISPNYTDPVPFIPVGIWQVEGPDE
jgi:hypothetical protein